MAVTAPALRVDLDPGHVPIEVTAHLRTGVGFDQPYGLDLAGILAARVRRLAQATLDTRGALATQPLPDTTEDEALDLVLPLSRCSTGEDWHWLATCATPVDPLPDPEPRTFYRVVDSRWAQHAADRPLPYFHPSGGPYRDVMMPAPVTVCRAVRWRAAGDPEAVRALLTPLRFIGRRRATGEGGVLSWDITTPTLTGDVGEWVHADGDTLLRPCPTACADALGKPYTTGWYALRPPSWHPDRLSALAMTAPDEEDDGW